MLRGTLFLILSYRDAAKLLGQSPKYRSELLLPSMSLWYQVLIPKPQIESLFKPSLLSYRKKEGWVNSKFESIPSQVASAT